MEVVFSLPMVEMVLHNRLIPVTKQGCAYIRYLDNESGYDCLGQSIIMTILLTKYFMVGFSASLEWN